MATEEPPNSAPPILNVQSWIGGIGSLVFPGYICARGVYVRARMCMV